MKRLKAFFRGMEQNTANYVSMYNGSLSFGCEHPPYTVYDPTYYDDSDFGYRIEVPDKLRQDCPIVLIMIPAETLLDDGIITNGGMFFLKRLKYYFRQMEESTATYSYKMPGGDKNDIYDGFLYQVIEKHDGSTTEFPEKISDSTYYEGENSYTLEKPDKLSIDKPIVKISIPIDESLPDLCSKIIPDETNELPRECVGEIKNAAADFCLRAFLPYIDALNAELYNRSRPDSENGKFYAYRPKGEILTRNCAYFDFCPQRDYEYLSGNNVILRDDGVSRPQRMCLCLRIRVQLPRKKLKKAMTMLTQSLPEAVEEFAAELNRKKLDETVALAVKQYEIREFIKNSNYAAFIANGSILPRAKDGVSPLEGAVPFKSTAEDEITVCGVSGMGIKRGVTVITGGGYSGKSTLLDAISAGIYSHCAGDGRELVISDPSAVGIAAEDGRSVKKLNISPFIKELPTGDTSCDTSCFSTAHASGSTSQASNIMEAVDIGSRLLLIDEDRSATNFMIRDSKMKALIRREPITPFTDRVRELAEMGISTILVIGGSGEYLGVCDRVYLMDEYMISDVTAEAAKIWRESDSAVSGAPMVNWNQSRRLSGGFTSYPDGSTTERLEVIDLGIIFIGDEKLDLRGLYNLVSPEQLNALAFIMRTLMLRFKGDDIKESVDRLYDEIAADGVNILYSSFFTTMDPFIDLPRKEEVLAAISRLRKSEYILR